MRLTLDQFCELVSARRGAQFITLHTRTVPDMLKTNNPFYGQIEKLAKVNGVANWIYENAVNNQRIREELEPDFEAIPRCWGARVPGLPLVINDGGDKLYLELKVQSVLEETYLHKGKTIAYEEIQCFLRPARESSRQGVEREIILRDYTLTAIEKIVIGGTTYDISGRTPETLAKLASALRTTTKIPSRLGATAAIR